MVIVLLYIQITDTIYRSNDTIIALEILSTPACLPNLLIYYFESSIRCASSVFVLYINFPQFLILLPTKIVSIILRTGDISTMECTHTFSRKCIFWDTMAGRFPVSPKTDSFWCRHSLCNVQSNVDITSMLLHRYQKYTCSVVPSF